MRWGKLHRQIFLTGLHTAVIVPHLFEKGYKFVVKILVLLIPIKKCGYNYQFYNKSENLQSLAPDTAVPFPYRWSQDYMLQELWELEGIVGLYNKPGRGSKPLFNDWQKAQIKEWAKQEPRPLKKVSQKVQ